MTAPRKKSAQRIRAAFALFSAELPAHEGSPVRVSAGHMRSEIAAALVGAGMLSVLLFPTFAGVLLSRLVRTAPSALS
jgi:hypothetical protein